MLPSWQKELTRISNNWGDTSMTRNQLVSFMIGQQSLMNDKSTKKRKPDHSGNYPNYSFARRPHNQYYPGAHQIPATPMYPSNCGTTPSPFRGRGFGRGCGMSAHDDGRSNAGSFSPPRFNRGGSRGFFSPGGRRRFRGRGNSTPTRPQPQQRAFHQDTQAHFYAQAHHSHAYGPTPEPEPAPETHYLINFMPPVETPPSDNVAIFYGDDETFPNYDPSPFASYPPAYEAYYGGY